MISVIILTFNSIKLIGNCLNSLLFAPSGKLEVIVVDNGSRDGTQDFIKKNYPQAILIENKNNLGACKGRNQGISIAKGEWVLTLDCDVTLEKNFISVALQEIAALPPGIGMIQPKILKSDKKTVYSAGIYLSCIRRFYDIGNNQLDNPRFSSMKNIFGVCSAAAFYRKVMLEQLKEETGYFDERFFFLVEDVDLSWRARKKGWEALFLPDLVCRHQGNGSNTPGKVRKLFCLRNRYLMILKNEDKGSIYKVMIAFIFYDLPRVLFFLFSGILDFRKSKDIFCFLGADTAKALPSGKNND